jgi:general secretion pathway protein J
MKLLPRAQRSACGFTLVEILIAIGILGLILTAIFSSWTAILRASKTGLDAAAAVQRARIAARTIEESLGSTEGFVANQQYYSFAAENGSEAYLTFVARLSKSFPRSGKFGDLDVRRLTYSVEQSPEGGHQLVLRQTPLIMDMDIDEKEHPIVLAKNVREFKTEFWDGKMQDWSDEWKQAGSNTLPVMVKVTLKLADNPYSTVVREQVTRIVSLPSVAVQTVWQMPRAPGQPGGPPIQPGQPGFIPGQMPGGGAQQPGMMPGQPGYPQTPQPGAGKFR